MQPGFAVCLMYNSGTGFLTRGVVNIQPGCPNCGPAGLLSFHVCIRSWWDGLVPAASIGATYCLQLVGLPRQPRGFDVSNVLKGSAQLPRFILHSKLGAPQRN